MRSASWLSASILVGVIALYTCSAATSQEGNCIGYIEEVRGTVLLRPVGSKREIQLDPKRHKGHQLLIGDRLKVGKSSLLRTCMYGLTIKKSGPSGWLEIPKPRSQENDRKLKALRLYARIAGRERASGSPIFSPAPDSVVKPESLGIRWVASKRLGSIRITIRGNNDKIWSWSQKADGASGLLNSESARAELIKYRADGGTGPLTLTMVDQDGDTKEPLEFRLLSVEEEQALKTSLAQWDEEKSPLMRHLGRASEFEKRRMYSEVAAEYEQALAKWPGSVDVTLAAIREEKRVGNTLRVLELRKLLPPGTKVNG